MRFFLTAFLLLSYYTEAQQSYIDYRSPFHPVINSSGMVVSQNKLSSDLGIR